MTIAPKYVGDPARPFTRGGGPLRRLITSYTSSRERMWVAERQNAERGEIVEVWRLCCESTAELRVDTDTVSGLTIGVPSVQRVSYAGPDGPPILLVQLRPGMLPEDITCHARRFAEAFGCRTLTVAPAGINYPVGCCWVRFVAGPDPLLQTVPFLTLDNGHVVWGRSETGAIISINLHDDAPHTVVQGQTGSGKSIWTYGVLAQLAHRADIRVVGSDPTGLLWRPWPESPDRVSGLRDPAAHEAMLARLIAEMDDRLESMPAMLDKSPTGVELPVIVVVLEEYAGLLRAADQADKETGKAIRSHVSRLLAESRKVGFRVLMLLQRAEATIIGGAERSNLSGRLSFRVDNRESVKMLHGVEVPDEVVTAQLAALPGVALFQAPGVDVARLRGPYVTYRDYCTAVA